MNDILLRSLVTENLGESIHEEMFLYHYIENEGCSSGFSFILSTSLRDSKFLALNLNVAPREIQAVNHP
jgi:hypothetical protein